jgi:hypothetical protein
MALVDLSATGEDNILADAKNAAEADLKWRDKQLLRLKDEVFDLEDEQEGVTLAEFSLEDFRADLLHFSRQNQTALADAPIGISAMVPPNGDGETFDPGVIFCLRRKGQQLGQDQKPVGGLDPFFLVYVRQDGSIRHGFAAPKTILDAMRAMCVGHTEPVAALCEIFDRETDKGQNMDGYDALALAAVDAIKSTYATRALSTLAATKGGKLADAKAQPRSEGDFELITWLIITTGEERA